MLRHHVIKIIYEILCLSIILLEISFFCTNVYDFNEIANKNYFINYLQFPFLASKTPSTSKNLGPVDQTHVNLHAHLKER